jgi:aminomethyltransferase
MSTEPRWDGTSRYFSTGGRLSPYLKATKRAGAVGYHLYNRIYWPTSYRHSSDEALTAIMERVVMMDVCCQRPVAIQGPDALAFADYLCTRDLSTLGLGRCRHTVVCDDEGILYCEAMVLRPDEETVWVFNGSMDFRYWARAVAIHTDFDVVVEETTVAPIAIQGPKAYDLMRDLAPEAADLKFYRWVKVSLAGQECIIARAGWSGQFGYEVYPLDSPNALPVWELIERTGEPHGLLVSEMTGPYFERAVTDMTYGWNLRLNPFEARLGRAVDLDAGEFIGKAALLRVREEGPRRQMLGLRFAGRDLPSIEWFWPINDDQGELGLVLDTADSPLLDALVGYAVVDRRTMPGHEVRVGLPGGGEAMAHLVELPFME